MGKWERLEDEKSFFAKVCCKSSENVKIQTITRKVLKDASNGQKIITDKLDNHLKPTKDCALDKNAKNAMNFAMEVDFTGIVDPKSSIQCRVLFDILDLLDTLKLDCEAIITHPVMALFIWSKWQKVKKYYYFQSLCYFMFLMSYTFLLYSMFGTNLLDENGTYKNKVKRLKSCQCVQKAT